MAAADADLGVLEELTEEEIAEMEAELASFGERDVAVRLVDGLRAAKKRVNKEALRFEEFCATPKYRYALATLGTTQQGSPYMYAVKSALIRHVRPLEPIDHNRTAGKECSPPSTVHPEDVRICDT